MSRCAAVRASQSTIYSWTY